MLGVTSSSIEYGSIDSVRVTSEYILGDVPNVRGGDVSSEYLVGDVPQFHGSFTAVD
jgi:hypothetical protein